ncbi:MAG: sialidase family protein [Candidatus Bathyarchaeia archaeon]
MKHVWFFSLVIAVTASFPLMVQASTWLGGDISLDFNDQSKPQVAVSGEVVHVVWVDSSVADGGGVWVTYIRSIDGGDTWSDPVRITGGEADPRDPDVAAYGDYVYVVWEDLRDYATTGSDIYMRRSGDGGITWEPEQRLVSSAANQWDPKVAAYGEYLHLTWLDERNMAAANYDIYYRRSATSGRTWDGEQRLTSNPYIQWRQSIAACGDHVYVVYEDYRDWHYPPGSSKGVLVYYARSVDGGESWSTENKLPTNGSWQLYPDVAATENDVYIAYTDGRDFSKSRLDIWIIQSRDNGESWSEETRMTDDPAIQEYPRVAASGEGVEVVWQDHRNMKGSGMDIYCRSRLHGSEWEAPSRFTEDGWQHQPAIAASDGRVHIVWTDESLMSTNGQEVFYITR